ncbi:MAG: MauE/DoxX family redox-associated membrane protein [bacterium]|nr:MauE/DoxX family redox-associated membrane protein [bacterium]
MFDFIWKFLANKYMSVIFRLLLGIIFIWSGVDKIIQTEEFAKIISNYNLLPDFAINLLAIVLPWIEFVAGLLLISGLQNKSSSFIILGLLTVFTLAISIALLRGLDIECGCFGSNRGRVIALPILIEDIFLFLMALQVFLSDKRFRPVQSM